VTGPVHVVLPGDIDDPATPSGGNRYDRRVCDGLTATRDVHEIAVGGGWPHPSPTARRTLAAALAGLSDRAVVLLDGLVAGPVPEIVEDQCGRLRLIVLVHLPLGDETGLSPAVAATLTAAERRTLHAAAGVIATSAGAARRLTLLYGLPGAKVHVAVPGVDPAPPACPSRGGGRLLCVAAVTPRKGQDVLAEALSRCTDLAWTCTCVGALDRAPSFAAAVQNGLISFVGTRTGAALDAAYADADLFVLPSRAETYGMVVTEALARGLPVLATAVDGVPEALGTAPDGSLPGLLVPPDHPDALAAAIRRWLTDPGWRGELRAAAAKRRETLDGWDETVRRVNEVLDA
jgi:glycosyltransferase involved in cell wall biosynthesis